MWLLNCDTAQLEPFEGEDRPPYAILSHRWEGKEVNYQDVMAGNHVDQKGWQKIKSCCEQAKRDGLDYVWADTCCIDKKSSAELSEAINSMYQWYRQAKVCYAYLADVDSSAVFAKPSDDNNGDSSGLSREISSDGSGYVIHDTEHKACSDVEKSSDHLGRVPASSDKQGIKSVVQKLESPDILSQFANSAWFTRGWTLQELLAPVNLTFYDCHWIALGTKQDFRDGIQQRTGIQAKVLDGSNLGRICVAEKMSWAAGRKTTRIEDRAYSLLGIFGVNMPLLYGEGERAFNRLQSELIRVSDDLSILAWLPINRSFSDGAGSVHKTSLLAPSPDCFLWDPCFRWIVRETSQTSLDKDRLTGEFLLKPVALQTYAAILGWMECHRKISREQIASLCWPLNFSESDHPKYYAMAVLVKRNIESGSWHKLSFGGRDQVLLPQSDFSSCTGLDSRTKITIEPFEHSKFGMENVNDKDTQFGMGFSLRAWLPGSIYSCRDLNLSGKWNITRRVIDTITGEITGTTDDQQLFISPSLDRFTRRGCLYVQDAGSFRDLTFVIEFTYNFMGRPMAHLHTTHESNFPIVIRNKEEYKKVQCVSLVQQATKVRRSRGDYPESRGDYPDYREEVGPFYDIDKEKANGAEVVRLEWYLKVAFLPLRDGHRVLFAFEGSHHDLSDHLPRQWLYPPLPT